jgi:hypothetical protein
MQIPVVQKIQNAECPTTPDIGRAEGTCPSYQHSLPPNKTSKEFPEFVM